MYFYLDIVRPYYYVREIARVDGKPKVVNQVYIGSPERILEMVSQKETMPEKIQSQYFGALWLANLVEKEFGIAGLIDKVVGTGKEGKQPSVGEYILYAIYNRMVDACSKRAMPDWYKQTAIQQIRPVNVDALNSQLFWQKWDRVEQHHLEHFSREFLRKVSQTFPASSECFMFDTTNYYTFIASEIESELAQRGMHKEGRIKKVEIG